MSKTFTLKDLSAHGKDAKQLLVAIDGGVYDVTEFADEHPGGKKILVNSCGGDASEKFWSQSKENTWPSLGSLVPV
ncbi:hypothetical protein OIV83_002620 [Microbotryomycetes sp. JL201]|nr:hypothetical protein OIV83_002620 [Microbotryomycetes sp. JL201]